MNSNLCLSATAVTAVFAVLAINTTIFSPLPDILNDQRTEYVAIDGGIGPESFAFDGVGGGPYTGISDGRIIKWLPEQRRWIDFAVTSSNRTGCEEREKAEEREERCGRPLGLRFKDGGDGDGDLYIADAYMGLLRIGANGGFAERLEFQTQDDQVLGFDSLRFANSLDIDQLSGHIYFTDSSSHYQRRNFVSAILSGDNSGRLMKYDPKTKQVNLLLGNLSFPNGVSLSKNNDFLLLAETTKCRILKYWLKTAKVGSYDVVADLPGFPDNIKTSRRGGFWVGIHSRKRGLLSLILSRPWIGKALVKLLPSNYIEKIYSCLGKWIGSGGLGMRLSEEGEVMEIIEGKGELKWRSISEVEEREDGIAWIGSINTPFAAKIKIL